MSSSFGSPTCDNEHEAAYQFDGNPNKKLAFWASIILEMKEQGIQTPTQNCLDEKGELKKEVLDIAIIRYTLDKTLTVLKRKMAYGQ